MALDTLSLENLSRVVQVDGGGGGATEAASNRIAAREMQNQGLSTPDWAGGRGQASDTAGSFAKILTDSVDQVNKFQHQADHAMKEMVAGRNKNIHETMLIVERADTALKLMMQVRNKLLEAYREIMRMQV